MTTFAWHSRMSETSRVRGRCDEAAGRRVFKIALRRRFGHREKEKVIYNFDTSRGGVFGLRGLSRQSRSDLEVRPAVR